MANRRLLQELVAYFESRFADLIVDGRTITLNAGVCYSVSRAASDILTRLGYRAVPKRVEMAFKSATHRYELYVGVRPPEASQESDYWIHYVVHLPDDNEVMDLTAAAASRPQFGLCFEPFWTRVDGMPAGVVSLNEVDDDLPAVGRELWARMPAYWERLVDDGARLLAHHARTLPAAPLNENAEVGR